MACQPIRSLPLDVNKAIRCWFHFGAPSRDKAHPSSSKIHNTFPLKTKGKDIISRCIPPFSITGEKAVFIGHRDTFGCISNIQFFG